MQKKLAKDESNKDFEKKVSQYERLIKQTRSKILGEQITAVGNKIDAAEKAGKYDESKELKTQIKDVKAEKRALDKQLMDKAQANIQTYKMVDQNSFRLNTDNAEHQITIVLFYQYIEPAWTYSRTKEAIRFAQTVGDSLGLGGRLRTASEGFNGTISGSYKNVRQFTEELKKWEPESFKNTLFKFIDGLPQGTHFPEFRVFEIQELVNYGLDGRQPIIKDDGGGTHLPPKEYHKKMEEPNSVIIDVRNTYESIIGRFQPPDEQKCKFIDPGWRKSTEFPDWLASEKTKQELKGKNVLMYCTGGVRCERASAWVKQELGDQVNSVYQLEGGIEQYMKEFPEGGHWVGKNYTFDKRFAFGAYGKDYREDVVLSKCSGCKQPWDRYRGKKRCSACLVPLLVCKECQDKKLDKKMSLRCTLCEEQNVTPKPKKIQAAPSQPVVIPQPNPLGLTRLFVGNLPFDAKEETVRSLFRPAKLSSIQWITDKNTQKFYGTVFVEAESPEAASYCLGVNGRKLKGRDVKVKFESKASQNNNGSENKKEE